MLKFSSHNSFGQQGSRRSVDDTNFVRIVATTEMGDRVLSACPILPNMLGVFYAIFDCWIIKHNYRPRHVYMTMISCRLQTPGTRCITANVLQLVRWTLSLINLRPSYVDNASCRKSPIYSYHTYFNLPHLHLGPQLGVTPFEFCRDFWHQKTRVPGLLCDVVCVILRLAVLIEHQLVTVGQTGRHTTTANTHAS